MQYLWVVFTGDGFCRRTTIRLRKSSFARYLVCVSLVLGAYGTVLSGQAQADEASDETQSVVGGQDGANDSEPYAPDQLLVRFRSGVSAQERTEIHEDNGAELEHRLKPEAVDVVELDDDTSIQEAVESYREDHDVLYAEPNYRISLAGEQLGFQPPISGNQRIKALAGASTPGRPNDLFFPGNSVGEDLWGLDNGGQNEGNVDADIDAPEAWAILGSGIWQPQNFAVGVIDSGVDSGHEDLAGKIVPGCLSSTDGDGRLKSGCQDDNGHGTHVSGTIAAVGNNGIGSVGVAPNAKVYMCKAIGGDGEGFVADVVACINDVVAVRNLYNIRVMSLSLGGGGSQTLEAAVNDAWNNGVLVIAAAGNDGNTAVNYPGGYESVVSVGATDRLDGHASFSNVNSDVEISAPGVGIVSTFPGGNVYAASTGTSMATPHVAAVAGEIGFRYGLSGGALRSALDASVDDLGPAGRDSFFGYGRANLCKAVGGSCGYSPGPNAAPTARFTASPSNPKPGDRVVFNGTDSSDAEGRVVSYRWDLDGDGTFDDTGSTVRTTYTEDGIVKVTLTVLDDRGKSALVTRAIRVGLGVQASAKNKLKAGITARSKYRIRTVLKKGLTVRCRANRAATCKASLLVSSRQARRLGLASKAAKTRKVGSARVKLTRSGSKSLRIRLTKSARRGLRAVRSVSFQLKLKINDRAGHTESIQKRIRLVR